MMGAKQKRTGGRKVGRPAGPTARVRRNRVVIMLTDSEFAKLHRLAAKRDLPLGTVSYQMFAPVLKRQK